MSISRFNSEGYFDPTQHDALTAIEKEERMSRGKGAHFASLPPLVKESLVYICSPYRGDVAANEANAQRYCRRAYESGKIPIAPHLYLTRFLDDGDPVERKAGLCLAIEAMRLCSEVWVCGGTVSHGMQCEIAEAKRRRIRIRHIESEGRHYV